MKKNLFGFRKDEKLMITSVLLVIFILGFFNFKTALRRRRDFQRKDDIRNITEAIEAFNIEYGFFPEAKDNKILGCHPLVKGKKIFFEACRWGEDTVGRIKLSVDPKNDEGFSYAYLSSPEHYQVFTALESDQEPEYNPIIEKRGVKCGVRICNSGLGNAPLDKSIQEYENEINEN